MVLRALPTAANRARLAGTFTENRELPVHRWFPYLAGFSASWVRDLLDREQPDLVLDPFSGVGTTLLESALAGIPSVGIEANPVCCRIAEAKLAAVKHGSIAPAIVGDALLQLEEALESHEILNPPEPLKRVFSVNVFSQLQSLLAALANLPDPLPGVGYVAVAALLKELSNCFNFSPYYQYREEEPPDIPVWKPFSMQFEGMLADLELVSTDVNGSVLEGDNRTTAVAVENADLLLTSPPYLNNWDYSWLTRIEQFFFTAARRIEDLNTGLRRNLMTSSTFTLAALPKESRGKVRIEDRRVRQQVEDLQAEVRKNRAEQGGKYPYDVVVGEYFSDLNQILRRTWSWLAPGAAAVWVVGDSALYGTHIDTPTLLGQIAGTIGFELEEEVVLRARRATRHRKPLRESAIHLRVPS